MNYSFKIFDFAFRNTNIIKNIVMFYSEFSYGFDKLVSGEAYRGIIMDRVFAFPYRRHEQESDVWSKTEFPPREGDVNFKEMGFFHTESPSFMGPEFTAEKRARAHFRLSAASPDAVCQHEHLLKLVRSVIGYGRNIVIVIPPVRSDYRNLLPPMTSIFGPLYDIARQYKIDIVNLLSDYQFEDADFGDADHLQPWGNGSKIVMSKISSALGVR